MALAGLFGATAGAEPVPLATLWREVAERPGLQADHTLTGTIRSLDESRGLLALEDASAAAILKLNLPAEAWRDLRPGEGLELTFRHSVFGRRDFAIECGTGAIAEADGRHPPQRGMGALQLEAGPQPIRVEWFNGRAAAWLQIGLGGPGLELETIPASMLSHRAEGTDARRPGLNYERFELPGLVSLDEIAVAKPAQRGTVADFDLTLAGGAMDVALRFDGFIEIPAAGEYLFRLTSDDGGRLFIGRSVPQWRLLPAPPEPAGVSFPAAPRWASYSGKVLHAVRDRGRTRIEIQADHGRIEAIALERARDEPLPAEGERVSIAGVDYGGVLGWVAPQDLRTLQADLTVPPQLTRAAEVRQLQPEQAAEAKPVQLEGVVTMANYRSLVLQDESGGIFVLAEGGSLSPMPKVGERWKIDGVTLRGDFSPIVVAQAARFLGPGALPPPKRPTWEELLNGTLDAEQVEIEGVVIAATDSEAELLTLGGTALLQSQEAYPFPVELQDPALRARIVGGRVRLRGVFATSWNRNIERLTPGILSLGNATLTVDEPPPASPEAIPRVTVPDLWRFASNATGLRRVRLSSQMMAQRDDLYLLSDGSNSLRLESRVPLDLQPGDEVEVAGFARTGAVSPVLVQPVIQHTRPGALPAAQSLAAGEVPDLKWDGRRVALEAKVLGDTFHQRQRTLELEAGQRRFLAIAPAAAEIAPLERDTRVRVTGAYFADPPELTGTGSGSFELRLAHADDIQVLARPAWWTPRRLALLVSVLLGGLALVIGWAAILHRLVARRTSQLAVEIQEREHAETERTLEMERARVARDLHDELGAGLTEIGMLSSLLESADVPAAAKTGYLATLREVSLHLVTGLDEIVWAINPSYDSVDDAAAYLWLYAQRMLKPAGIECRLQHSEEIPRLHFGSRRRHSLFLAFKEALNNVVRHARATIVTLGISIEDGAVVVTLADNGVGFDPARTPDAGSQGLAGMRQRMQAFGGDCEVTSAAGAGVTIRLLLPLKIR